MAAIFDFIKIAQGWQLHIHLDIIMGMPDMNNQNTKKNCIKQNKFKANM